MITWKATGKFVFYSTPKEPIRPELDLAIEELLNCSGFKDFLLFICDKEDEYRYFAQNTIYIDDSVTISFSKGLIDDFSDQEILAILAHEVGELIMWRTLLNKKPRRTGKRSSIYQQGVADFYAAQKVNPGAIISVLEKLYKDEFRVKTETKNSKRYRLARLRQRINFLKEVFNQK